MFRLCGKDSGCTPKKENYALEYIEKVKDVLTIT